MQEPQSYKDESPSPAQEKEWIKEASITYGGLAGLGLIMLQPFMYQGEFTGLAAKICVVSFAISIPILAALLLLSHEEDFKKHMSTSVIAMAAKSIAQFAAVVGFVAGIWHINSFAGKVAVASCIFAVSVHSAGYAKLNELKNKR